ncbi:MAG: SMC family ATPase [Anaerolineae bacterium]|jgi:DNA repair protein SbcC/Rad50|nr:SMC family ATPase [Anaerolineae bacterium]MBT7070091.1 SMC family ATPase [Anaerolineae bacterium]MBT7326504.1 SMC family ATPase [Anaerolineae bacterium]
MIPISLKISGFLSYRNPVELDFTEFSLACISGHNGAGKSSLLDAITWSLFGQARKRDESLINLQSKSAEIIYTFDYEGNRYRIQRSMPRGKKKNLEFQIDDDGLWRPLTEHTLRATQERIEQTLRLDYETFINAAFFLQGKADQFTQQNASQRKETLGSILGLEVWDEYKNRAATQRREIEQELDTVDGRVAEIDAELDEEEIRKARLSELENELGRLSATRKAQESVLENIRRLTASLDEQRKLVNTLAEALSRSQRAQADTESRRTERAAERERYADLLARATEVDAAYAAWKETRETLARWEETAAQFHEQDAKRQPFLQEIGVEEARLKQEFTLLREQGLENEEQSTVIGILKEELALAEKAFEEIAKKVEERDAFQKEQSAAREKYAALQVENKQFKTQMDALKERIEEFAAIETAACPLCGQDLNEEHRAETLTKMEKDGKTQGDQYRANTAEMNAIYEKVQEFDAQNSQYKNIEQERLAASTKLTQLNERFSTLQASAEKWANEGKKRLAELEKIIVEENFAKEFRAQLADVNAELKKLGYDAAAHDAARQQEKEQRAAEDDFRTLENSRAALKPLEEELANLDAQIAKGQKDMDAQQAEYDGAQAALDAAKEKTPDENAAYADLLQMQEKENQLNQEVGAARQKVEVLDSLRIRKTDYASQREALALQISRYKKLERAFGKDGVPALLIEQALPEIEEKANDILDRLSNGQMSIRFVTQASYKDSKRDDMKETLDIQISDSAGVRDYEMFSGGEAFRVNFAIRLALSQALSQRKGARLQTLIIDEGFGSQDAQGRQRLIEAINQIKGDFAKILIITHLESLKEAFPTQIVVEKGENGSTVQVI